jgi:L-cysteine/cystine lyase
MNTTEQQRQHFPALANKYYFNYGGQGPLPDVAMEAIINTYREIERIGPFSGQANLRMTKIINSLREAIASELGVNPTEITLTENVTAGCNIVLWGIDWRPGDRLLLSDCEHPGIVATVQEIARRFSLEVVTYPLLATLNQNNPLNVIEEYLCPGTRLLILSHLLWNTGELLPLDQIVRLAHQRSIPVLADAAQSVGSIPLDLTALGIDYYAFTGHKWLCGPAGVGGLYISPNALEQIQPTFIGWRGVNLDVQGQPIGWKPGGLKLEVATSAYPLYEGLREAIALHQQWGTPAQRHAQICQSSGYLWEKLAKIPELNCLLESPPPGGLVSFTVKGKLSESELLKLLEEQGFLLRTLTHPNCLRACVHYFTLASEIDRLVELIQMKVSSFSF